MKKLAYDLFVAILQGVVASSYLICLCVALMSIILYVCGCKKAGKYVSVSIVVYILIQALKGTLIK